MVRGTLTHVLNTQALGGLLLDVSVSQVIDMRAVRLQMHKELNL